MLWVVNSIDSLNLTDRATYTYALLISIGRFSSRESEILTTSDKSMHSYSKIINVDTMKMYKIQIVQIL